MDLDGLKFWKDTLTDAPKANKLSYQVNLTASNTTSVYFTINKHGSVPEYAYSTNNYFMLLWGLLLSRYCNQEKVSIRYNRQV